MLFGRQNFGTVCSLTTSIRINLKQGENYRDGHQKIQELKMKSESAFRKVSQLKPGKVAEFIAEQSDNPSIVMHYIEYASIGDRIYCNEVETYVPIMEFARDIILQNYGSCVTTTSVAEYCIPISTTNYRWVKYPSLDDYDMAPQD